MAYGMWVPIAVWQVRLQTNIDLYTLLYFKVWRPFTKILVMVSRSNVSARSWGQNCGLDFDLQAKSSVAVLKVRSRLTWLIGSKQRMQALAECGCYASVNWWRKYRSRMRRQQQHVATRPPTTPTSTVARTLPLGRHVSVILSLRVFVCCCCVLPVHPLHRPTNNFPNTSLD